MPGTPILSLQVASSSPAQLGHPASPPPPPESPPPVDDEVGPEPAVDAPAPPAPPSLSPAQPERRPSMATARATCILWLVSTATSTSWRWGRMAPGCDQAGAHDPSVCRFEHELPAWRRRFPEARRDRQPWRPPLKPSPLVRGPARAGSLDSAPILLPRAAVSLGSSSC